MPLWLTTAGGVVALAVSDSDPYFVVFADFFVATAVSAASAAAAAAVLWLK